MFRKKIVPLVLVGCMLTTGMPAFVYAAADSASSSIASIDIPATGEIVVTGGSSQEPKSEDLERVLKLVKAKITVPAEYSQFDYNFNASNYYGGATWSLNWSTKDNEKNMSIQSDQNGNIISYNTGGDGSGNYAPKYLKADLKSAADKFIKKIAPDISGKLKYIGANGSYGGVYNYEYQRVENGIPMPDNSVTVGVNYKTGKVMSYSANWLYQAEIPSPDTKITKDEAAKKIGKTIKMKLTYQNAYTPDKDGKTEIKAFLVYSPDNSYISVDAKTGEVYTTQNAWVQYTDEKGLTEAAASGNKSDSGLTDEEITKVDEIKGLISKDAAIKAITENKGLLLDANLKSISASLYKQNNYYTNDDKTRYAWNITLSDPREIDKKSGDNYRAYANASVDAVTGKIISFRTTVKDYNNMTAKELEKIKVKYDREQGQSILEGFLKAQIPDKFNNSKLTDDQGGYVIAYDKEKEIYGGYNYNYNRVNEGIEYPLNGIYGAVDGVTGKITSFNYNWNENVTFEAPKNIINPDNAFNIYIQNKGYQLVYEINNIHSYDSKGMDLIRTDAYSVDSKVRLVYRTDISPNTISPFTGKQIDNNGDEYIAPENLYDYKDINNSLSARNIKLLAELGIGFKGGEFKPDQAITTKELTDFLNQSGIYYNNNKYKINNDTTTITRVAAAKFAVQILGYESIAKLKGIYDANFKDQNQISSENQGYTALAQGLNLITGNADNEFRPNDKLTRGEAADLIIAMLNVEK
jgi:hypothetical protein